MVYTGGAFKGFDATYGYVTRAIRLLRLQTGNPDVSIHVAGGVANRLGPEELAGFAAAVSDDGGTIGVSLYDWATTPSGHWRVLRRSVGRPGVPQSVAGLEQVLGQHLHVGQDGHEVRVARPARDDVQVHVVGDARSGWTTEVPAQVEAVAAVGAAEGVDACDGQPVELERFLVGEVTEVPACRSGAAIRCPDEYGYLFRSTTAEAPRCTTSDCASGSSPAPSSQKTHPGSSSAWAMYSRRQGAQSGFVTWRFYT